MKRIPLIILPLACLTACASNRASSNESAEFHSDSLSASTSVREPSRVHTYLINDYLDPNNPRVLHRGHAVDVVEQDERWDLNTADDPAPSSGPVTAADQPNAAPNPYSAEFETELAQQRAQYQQLAALGAQMTAEMVKLQDTAQKNADAVSDNATLRNRLFELQKEIDELKPLPAPPIAPNAPKKPSWFDSVRDLFRQLPDGTPVAQGDKDIKTDMILAPQETLRSATNAPALTNQPPTDPSPTNAPPSQEGSVPVPAPGEMSATNSAPAAQP